MLTPLNHKFSIQRLTEPDLLKRHRGNSTIVQSVADPQQPIRYIEPMIRIPKPTPHVADGLKTANRNAQP